jgi:hypothetical protein
MMMRLLASASPAQIKATSEVFTSLYGKSLEGAIEEVLGSDLKKAMLIRTQDRYDFVM